MSYNSVDLKLNSNTGSIPMARARTYRHDVRCHDCGSNWMRKNGQSLGKQSYKCGDCNRLYVPDGAYHRPSAATKAKGVQMYLEGSSMSAVGRAFGYSTVAVMRWVKKGGARH